MSGPWSAMLVALAASLFWAPLLYIAARTMERRSQIGAAALWSVALALLVMPLGLGAIIAAVGDSAVQILTNASHQTTASPLTARDAPPLQQWSAFIYAAGIIYFAGFLVVTGLNLFKHVYFDYRARFTTPADDSFIASSLSNWRMRLRIAAKPRILVTDLIHEFCVFGILAPKILAPRDVLEASPRDDVDLMIAHELAHIKRGDALLFSCLAALRAVYWFNPFAKQIFAEVEHQAEICADTAVTAAGASPDSYAHCFIDSLRRRSQLPPAPKFTPAFIRRPFARQEDRLRQILSPVEQKRRRSGAPLSWSVMTALGAGAVLQGAVIAASDLPAPGLRPLSGATNSPPPQLLNVDLYDEAGIQIYAASDGTVRAINTGARGSEVLIDYDGDLRARFKNLSDVYVSEGDAVAANELIGRAIRQDGATITLEDADAKKRLLDAAFEAVNETVYARPKTPPAPISVEAERLETAPVSLTID